MMNENTYYLTRSFLRSYGLVAAWAVFGAGVLLLVGRINLVAGLLVLVGLVMAFVALRGSSLREGEYSRVRVWLMLFTIMSTVAMGALLRLLARGLSLTVWWVYLLGIVALLVYCLIEFSRSSRRQGS